MPSSCTEIYSVFFENWSLIYYKSHFIRLLSTCSTNSVATWDTDLPAKAAVKSQFSIDCVTKFLLLPSELGRLQQPKWYGYAAFACSLSPIAAVQLFFFNLPYRKIWSEWRGNSDFTACHLFLFPHFPVCLAETPNSETPDRLFYPCPHPSGMTSSRCYLTPDIKLMVPIAVPFFLICPCSESRLCALTPHPDCYDVASQIRKLASSELYLPQSL